MNTYTVKKLNEILSLLNDSYSCLNNHKNDIENTQLKNLFLAICQHRQNAINELRQLIISLGAEPTESRTLLGTAHQFYENIKKALTGNDPLVITKEIKRGENILIETYKEAIKSEMPEDIKPMLFKQMQIIEEDIKEADEKSVTS